MKVERYGETLVGFPSATYVGSEALTPFWEWRCNECGRHVDTETVNAHLHEHVVDEGRRLSEVAA